MTQGTDDPLLSLLSCREPESRAHFQSVVKETAVIDTEPLYLTCDKLARHTMPHCSVARDKDERQEVAEVEDEAEEQEDKLEC